MARMILKQKLTLNEAGKLFSSISQEDMEKITHLEIDGKINADDFETMRDDMYSLTHINLKECDIEAIDGCRSLTEVQFDSSIIPTFGLKVFNGTERCVGVVPNGCAESY